MPIKKVYPPILARSRDLRHPLTPAEQKIWARVRDKQLGYKIRRQHPVDRFIADFYCMAARLAIEIDGDTHAEPDQAAYDAARTEWLEAHGHRVIRFSNDDVHRRLDAVLEAIRAACERCVIIWLIWPNAPPISPKPNKQQLRKLISHPRKWSSEPRR